MHAIRQIYEDAPDTINMPDMFRHRRTEVIFIAIDEPAEPQNTQPMFQKDLGIAEFFGCIPDFPVREQQGEYENRLELD
ncbi:MAG: hypothetical protein ACXWT1_14450 [Methylobacter sp.]